MVSTVIKWLATALAIFCIPQVVDGVHIDSFATALAASAVLSLINILIKPILFVLTLPFTVISFGFFLLVVNGLCFWMLGSFVPGVVLDGFWQSFWSALWVSIVSWVMDIPSRNPRAIRFRIFSNRPQGPYRPSQSSQSGKISSEYIDLEERPTGKWE